MFVNYYEKCSLSCKYFFKILFCVNLEKRESNNRTTWINDDSCINYYYFYAEHWTFFIRTKAMQMMSDLMDDCTLQLHAMRNGAVAECSIRLILWIISDWIRFSIQTFVWFMGLFWSVFDPLNWHGWIEKIMHSIQLKSMFVKSLLSMDSYIDIILCIFYTFCVLSFSKGWQQLTILDLLF